MLPASYRSFLGDDKPTRSILLGAARVLGLPPELLGSLPPALLARIAAQKLPALEKVRERVNTKIDAMVALQDWARERLREGGAHAA